MSLLPTNSHPKHLASHLITAEPANGQLSGLLDVPLETAAMVLTRTACAWNNKATMYSKYTFLAEHHRLETTF